MTPDASPANTQPDRCEGCGSPGGPSLLLDIPVPAAALARLGLPTAPRHDTRLLCEACAEKGHQGGKLDLLTLVKLAPAPVKQSIHAYLAHEFEI